MIIRTLKACILLLFSSVIFSDPNMTKEQSRIILNVEPSEFNVIAPIQIPINADNGGLKIPLIQISNKSTGPIKITGLEITKDNGWKSIKYETQKLTVINGGDTEKVNLNNVFSLNNNEDIVNGKINLIFEWYS